MSRTSNIPAALLVIVAASLLVRLALFGYLYAQGVPSYFELSDSAGYLQLAHNIADGHGFSEATSTPYLPASHHMPMLPTLTALSLYLFNSYLPMILLQIGLAAVLVVLAYKIAMLISGSERLALVAAGLMAFEPYSMFINMSLVTETLFAVPLVAGIYTTCRFLREPNTRDLVLTSVLFGLATYVRPIGQFLPLLLLGVVASRVPVREYARYGFLALIPFLLAMSPWIVRNYYALDSFMLSTQGFQNAYSDLGGAIVSVREHISWNEAKDKLEAEYRAQHHLSAERFQQDLSQSRTMFKEALLLMVRNPVPTFKAYVSMSLTFFTNDAWTYYLQRWGMLRAYSFDFSPSYVLITEGPLVALQRTVSEAGATIALPILGRLFWVLTCLLFFVGTLAMAIEGGQRRILAITLALFVLYFFALSTSVGFGINGRFRYPVNALFFTGAVIGGSLAITWLRHKLRRIQ